MMNESAIGQGSKPSPTTPPSGSTISAHFTAPIFLLGSHKSGTTLLRNLLDGSDGHFVVPVETHLFPAAGFWVQYALRQSLPRTLTYEQFRDGLLAHIDRSNRIVVIRFEDLLRQPELVMGQIADFVGVEFTEALLTPTTMGESWQGNSAVSGAFTGISQEPLSHWEKRLTPLEAGTVAAAFGHVLKLWGYPALDLERSPYRHCEREAPKTYFANRFLLRSLARDGLSRPF